MKRFKTSCRLSPRVYGSSRFLRSTTSSRDCHAARVGLFGQPFEYLAASRITITFVALIVCTLVFPSAFGQSPSEQGIGEAAPLSGSEAGSTPVEQVLSAVDTGGVSFQAEQQAAEIEVFLKHVAEDLTTGKIALTGKVQADFRGTTTRPAEQRLLRSQSGLESFQGTPSPNLTLTAEAFEADLKSLRAEYSNVDWVKFKIVGIESLSATTARTDVLWQMAGRGTDNSRRQMTLDCSFRWTKTGENQWQIAEFKAGPSHFARATKDVFRDVSYQAFGKNASFREQLSFGTELWRMHMDSASGMDVYGQQGLAVGDYDGDGLEDFYITQPGGLPNRLYKNLGNGEFRDVSAEAGVDFLDAAASAFFADIDNNGSQDLILILTSGQTLLFLNGGKGKFSLARGAFPPEATPGSVGGCLADYDRDGFIDIYVTAYLWPNKSSQLPRPFYDATNGPPNALFRNRGNKTFEAVTGKSGLNVNNNRFSHACTWSDYDHDGWPDLFVANDFGRKNLYHNNGDGTFKDVTAELGIEDHGAGMSVALGDYDNDGWEDVYFGNMWSSAGRRVTEQGDFKDNIDQREKQIYKRHARGNSLFRNTPNKPFDDVTLNAGVEFGRWAWCSDFLDFDNDGWLDLYVANGFVTGPDGKAPDL